MDCGFGELSSTVQRCSTCLSSTNQTASHQKETFFHHDIAAEISLILNGIKRQSLIS